jgi:hypothetical protein
MEQRASMIFAKREVERIGTRIKKLLNLMLDDEIAVDEGVEMEGPRRPSEGSAAEGGGRAAGAPTPGGWL